MAQNSLVVALQAPQVPATQQIYTGLSPTPNPPKEELKLYHSQEKAYRKVVEWLRSGSSKGFILSGYAGTGKTHVIKYLIANDLHPYLHKVVLCAPTNKAVKVLKALNTGCDCCTIYSLLGLMMEQYEDVLKLTKAEGSRDGKYTLVVLDEAGMTNVELLKYVEDSMGRGIRYLLVGDEEQINPVGEDKSKIWGRYGTARMTKVVRHDNQILNTATAVRQAESCSEVNFQTDNDGREGVWYLSDWRFERKLKKYARLGLFDEHSKAIAWRNKTVDSLNRVIRKELLGEVAAEGRWVAGDQIVFTSPMELENKFKIYTDDEARVTSALVCPHIDFPDLMCYYLTVKMDESTQIVKVIHEDSERLCEEMLSDFATRARAGDKKLWGAYWKLRKSMAYIKHAWAITAHRAQGSGYRNVFVAADDIMSNSNRNEAKRCLYVAVSRATTKLFIR